MCEQNNTSWILEVQNASTLSCSIIFRMSSTFCQYLSALLKFISLKKQVRLEMQAESQFLLILLIEQ